MKFPGEIGRNSRILKDSQGTIPELINRILEKMPVGSRNNLQEESKKEYQEESKNNAGPHIPHSGIPFSCSDRIHSQIAPETPSGIHSEFFSEIPRGISRAIHHKECKTSL